VAPGSRQAFNATLGAAFSVREKQTCEVSMLAANRPSFWAEVQAMSAARSAASSIGAASRSSMFRPENRPRTRSDVSTSWPPRTGSWRARLSSVWPPRPPSRKASKTPASPGGVAPPSPQAARDLTPAADRPGNPAEGDQPRVARQDQPAPHRHQCPAARIRRVGQGRPREIRRKIIPLRRLVEESVRTVHKFARDLRPAMLDDLGLIPALRSLVDDMARQRGLRSSLRPSWESRPSTTSRRRCSSGLHRRP